MAIDRKQNFTNKSNKVHNNFYDYSKVEYVNSTTKVCIICPIHGEFWQTPQAHARGNKCPKCANIKRGDTFRSSSDDFIKKAIEIHGDQYDYSKVEYKNSNEKVCIICKEHGEFWMTPMNHLLGQGCPKCSDRGLNTEEIIEMFKKKHGDKYDYSKVEYVRMHDKVCIICPIHGEFWQTPSKHLLGQGCPKCGKIKMAESNTMSTEDFINQAIKIHGDKYDYSNTQYNGTYEQVDIICPKHGPFKQVANYHLNGHGCPRCGAVISHFEDEVSSFIVDELKIEIIRNDRKILEGNEIDILIPHYKIGIECDGLKWHSEEYKPNNYHLDKTEKCKEKGIRLIHIFEDEWEFKKNIVKDKIKTLIGCNTERIYARDKNCSVKIPSLEEKRDFLNQNHIQGDVNDTIRYGLYYKDELIALMTFGKPRINLGRKATRDDEYELLRYCSKIGFNAVGGAGKLFKRFISEHSPKVIISYCDMRYSIGGLYEKIGFKLSHISQPNYYYIIGNNRKNRFKFRKSELIKEGFDPNKTEHEIMLERGIYRIYDCGNLVYEWKKEKS